MSRVSTTPRRNLNLRFSCSLIEQGREFAALDCRSLTSLLEVALLEYMRANVPAHGAPHDQAKGGSK